LTINQQVSSFNKALLTCKLFDWVAAVSKDSSVTVDVCDLGLGASCVYKTDVIGVKPGGGIEFREVNNRVTSGGLDNRKIGRTTWVI
jgi:hypothetical protein